MVKKRKTRKEKVRSSKRIEEQTTFKIKDGWLAKSDEPTNSTVLMSVDDKKYFRADLTKTFLLTMLVLAVELALWQILSRQ